MSDDTGAESEIEMVHFTFCEMAKSTFIKNLRVFGILASVIVCLTLLPGACDAAPDNRGTEFIIGFMENIDVKKKVELYVTTMKTTPVNVRVRAPKYSSSIDEQFTITAGQVKELFLTPHIRMFGTSKSSKGVWVTSNDEVVVYGVNKELYSNDGFLGLPVDALSTEYYAACWWPAKYQCQLMVVGTQDSTSVTIKISHYAGQGVYYKGKLYRGGSEIKITMNKFDTFQITSKKGDLTGTKVTSDKTVSVFSGNKKTIIGKGHSSDHLVEQWPPVGTWGKRFATVPIPERTVGDRWKFIGSEDNTKVTIKGKSYFKSFTVNAGRTIEVTIPSGDNYYCYIHADKPILVVQFCQTQQSKSEKSDPMMMMIPPIEQYGADYTFSTPKYSKGGSYINYFMFVVRKDEKNGLRVDGSAFPSSTRYIDIPGTNPALVGGYIKVREGSHTVRHTSPISTFGGYLYGRAEYETYGFSVGMRLSNITSKCTPVATVVGDGIDNDCDGLIDEEMCTEENQKKDDDNDGKTDEDCAKPSPIDGGWSEWGSYSACIKSCENGGSSSPAKKTRTRTCNNPKPKYDGKQCAGNAKETVSCSSSSTCPKLCKCSTSGDPHYYLFDGQAINFMGGCKYTLAKADDQHVSNPCYFNIEGKNDKFGSVSYNRLVDVKIFGTIIRMTYNQNLYVDGLREYPPYKDPKFQFSVTYTGNSLRLSSKCGLVVTITRSRVLEITVPKIGKLSGLCGDCNGKRDDYRTKDGRDVSSSANKFSLIGNSYEVIDNSDKIGAGCKEAIDPHPCSLPGHPDLRTKAERKSACQYLNPKNKDKSVFRKCIERDEERAKKMFDSCVYDYCSYFKKPNQLSDVLCKSIAGFADECQEIGLTVQWRNNSFCPLKCPPNAEYKSSMKGCPNTCSDPKASLDCNIKQREGCACKPGYILSDTKCVKPDVCGCIGENDKYYPIGTTVVSDDCLTVEKCESLLGTKPRFRVIEERKCGKNTICKAVNGSRRCICKDGFNGSPEKGCEKDCTKTIKGTEYKGFVDKTRSGKTCQHWKDQHPHKVTKQYSHFDKNYCRNLGDGATLWCYTMDAKLRWEYCDIPLCANEKPKEVVPPKGQCRKTANGKDYKGTWGITRSGKTCQRWDSQTPHKHSKTEFNDAANYCRNSGDGDQPWCYTTDINTRWDYCVIPICDDLLPKDVKECLTTEKGTKYKGYTSVTKSGKKCQHWAAQFPHTHGYKKNPLNSQNFCRNPDSHKKPWCYTTDPKTLWEYCDIPKCAPCSMEHTFNRSVVTLMLSGDCEVDTGEGAKCKYNLRLTNTAGIAATLSIGKKIHHLKENHAPIKDCATFQFEKSKLMITNKINA